MLEARDCKECCDRNVGWKTVAKHTQKFYKDVMVERLFPKNWFDRWEID